MELWKPVKGFEGYYEVSSLGRVRSVDRLVCTGIKHSEKRVAKGKILKPNLKKTGYLSVDLKCEQKSKTVSVHRLVAIAFCEHEPGKDAVNHKNLDKTDNRAINLEWCTYKENSLHAVQNGAMPGNGLKKKIRCCETGQVFDSSYRAADWLNRTKFNYTKQVTHMAQNIRGCCLGHKKSAYGYHWKDVIQEGSTTSP